MSHSFFFSFSHHFTSVISISLFKLVFYVCRCTNLSIMYICNDCYRYVYERDKNEETRHTVDLRQRMVTMVSMF